MSDSNLDEADKPLTAKIAELLRAKKDQVAEEASKLIPKSLMPRDAVLKKRKDYAEIDENLKKNR
jgi:hypothetical protein